MADEFVSRRRLLRTAFLGGTGLLAAYAVGCGDDDSGGSTPTSAATATRTPSPASPSAAPSPTTAGPTALSWKQLTPAASPPGRRDHSLVTDGEALYLFGGRAGASLGDTWAYDIAANVWRQVEGDGPVPRFGHNTAWDTNRSQMVMFGGQDSGFFNDAWEFDPAASRWTQLTTAAPLPAERYGAASALDPAGRLLISHGFTDAGRFDDTWSLTPPPGPAWSDASPAAGDRPIKRCLVRGAWDRTRERFLIFAGQTNSNPFLGDLWMLKGGAWTKLTAEPKPSPRNLYAMALDDEGGRLIVVGGRSEAAEESDVWFLDLASDTWTQATPGGEVFSARFGHDAAWVAETRTLYVFGGNDNSGNLDDLWALSVPL